MRLIRKDKSFLRRILGNYRYYKIFKSLRKFTFQGNCYRYFYHRYNSTWSNERSVEIPIAWRLLKQYQGKKILEVGAVLLHYFPIDHDVLDKYEEMPGVINKDIVGFSPPAKYDLIISISTFEHIGWDEEPCNPGKIIQAIETIKKMLSEGGKTFISLPLGYNPEMDKMIKEGKIKFPHQYYLKRVSKDNQWKEVNWPEVDGIKYESPFPKANGLLLGFQEK